MRVLLAVLLVGFAGCGGDANSPGDVAAPASPTKAAGIEDLSDAELADLLQAITEETTNGPSDQSGDNAVAAIGKLGPRIKQDDQGNVVELNLSGSKLTDAGLVHLKRQTTLQTLNLINTTITDTGLLHLKGHTNLKTLRIGAL